MGGKPKSWDCQSHFGHHENLTVADLNDWQMKALSNGYLLGNIT